MKPNYCYSCTYEGNKIEIFGMANEGFFSIHSVYWIAVTNSNVNRHKIAERKAINIGGIELKGTLDSHFSENGSRYNVKVDLFQNPKLGDSLTLYIDGIRHSLEKSCDSVPEDYPPEGYLSM